MFILKNIFIGLLLTALTFFFMYESAALREGDSNDGSLTLRYHP